MKKTVTILLAAAALMACGNNNNRRNTETTEATVTVERAVPENQNARNTINYTGTYKGTLPCADCEGIQTELTLNNDGTYQIQSEYKGRTDKTKVELKGNYTWQDNGNVIVLSGIMDGPSMYRVSENMLTQLDMSGNTITGANANAYILRK